MRERDFIKTIEIFEKRIDKLQKNQQYLEIIFLLSAILERELQEILFRYEDLVHISLTPYKDKGIDFSIKQFTKKDIEKMTLGEMIKYMSLCSKNKVLFEDLKEFNNLRRRVIHGLYQIKSIPRLEKQIKRYLPRFWKLMSELTDLELLIVKLIIKYIKNKCSILKRDIALKMGKSK